MNQIFLRSLPRCFLFFCQPEIQSAPPFRHVPKIPAPRCTPKNLSYSLNFYVQTQFSSNATRSLRSAAHKPTHKVQMSAQRQQQQKQGEKNPPLRMRQPIRSLLLRLNELRAKSLRGFLCSHSWCILVLRNFFFPVTAFYEVTSAKFLFFSRSQAPLVLFCFLCSVLSFFPVHASNILSASSLLRAKNK